MQQPIERDELGALVNAAWRASKKSADVLWMEYRLRRGGVGIDAFKTWLRGTRIPDADQFDIMAGVLNDSLVEAGKEPMLPRLVLIAPRGGGVRRLNNAGLDSAQSEREMPRYHDLIAS